MPNKFEQSKQLDKPETWTRRKFITVGGATIAATAVAVYGLRKLGVGGNEQPVVPETKEQAQERTELQTQFANSIIEGLSKEDIVKRYLEPQDEIAAVAAATDQETYLRDYFPRSQNKVRVMYQELAQEQLMPMDAAAQEKRDKKQAMAEIGIQKRKELLELQLRQGDKTAAQALESMRLHAGLAYWKEQVDNELVDLLSDSEKDLPVEEQAKRRQRTQELYQEQQQIEEVWKRKYGTVPSGASFGVVSAEQVRAQKAIVVEQGLTMEQQLQWMVEAGELVVGQKYYFAENIPDTVNAYRINHVQVTQLTNGNVVAVGHFASLENGNWGWTPRAICFDSTGTQVWSEKANRRPQDFNGFDGAVEVVQFPGKECVAVTYCVRSQDYANSEVLVKYYDAVTGQLLKVTNPATGQLEDQQILAHGEPGDFLDYTTAGRFKDKSGKYRAMNHWTNFKAAGGTQIEWAEYQVAQNAFVKKAVLLNHENDRAVQFAQFLGIETHTIDNQQVDVGVFGYAEFGTEEFKVIRRRLDTGEKIGNPIVVFNWKGQFLDPNKMNKAEISFRVATIARAAMFTYPENNVDKTAYAAIGTVLRNGKAEVKLMVTDGSGRVHELYLGGYGRHQVKADVQVVNGNQIVVGWEEGVNDQAMWTMQQVFLWQNGQLVPQNRVTVSDKALNYHGESYTGDSNQNGKTKVGDQDRIARFTDGGLGQPDAGVRGQHLTKIIEFEPKFKTLLPLIQKNGFLLIPGLVPEMLINQLREQAAARGLVLEAKQNEQGQWVVWDTGRYTWEEVFGKFEKV